MEANLHSFYTEEAKQEEEEEDYINMEVGSSFDSSTILSHYTKEFEFQSFSSSSDRDHTTTSPADELFYMGKLLPLHLPPRLQMVHKILQNQDEQSFATPLFSPTANNTPFESCNVSPSESCQVSTELNPNQYFLDYMSVFEEKKSWTKKVKPKLKWAYNLKSLFTKSSGCSNEHSAAAFNNAKQCVANAHHSKTTKNDKRSNTLVVGGHRRSFSGAFKSLSKTNKTWSISSSTSTSANFKTSNSSSSELDNPIQAAIAHCKKSQIANEHALYAIYDDQERSPLCRG
ncbi:hypothetical protein DH2020_022144 [Rehmannia glutinosa]|uniref:Membrane-associated kinase regulator 4 n=1 Tax=Rehmannia glutinosa TaxID=99300 RepID=A0ABR0WGX8_REHGL